MLHEVADIKVGPEGQVYKVRASGQEFTYSTSASVTSDDEVFDEWAVVPKSRILL